MSYKFIKPSSEGRNDQGLKKDTLIAHHQCSCPLALLCSVQMVKQTLIQIDREKLSSCVAAVARTVLMCWPDSPSLWSTHKYLNNNQCHMSHLFCLVHELQPRNVPISLVCTESLVLNISHYSTIVFIYFFSCVILAF